MNDASSSARNSGRDFGCEPAPAEQRTVARGDIAKAWTEAQRDAWRVEGFKMQIAQEAQARRDATHMRLAVLAGLGIGLAGAVLSAFTA